MDFRKLEYFIKVAEKRSFTEAARELFISPQALSQQIALLEQELGVRLFDRDTRRTELTENGQACYKLFKPVKLAFDKAQTDLTAVIKRQDEHIRAGFFNILPKNEFVTPWLELVQRRCGIDHLEIVAGDMFYLQDSLRTGAVDIILTNINDFTELPEFHIQILLTVPSQIVVSRQHPWAGQSQVSSADLAEADMLQLKRAGPSKQGNFYSRVPRRSVRHVPDFDAMLAILESGQYFAVFPPTFEFREHARFRYFDLPADLAFTAHTICACLKDNPSALVHELVRSSAAELDFSQFPIYPPLSSQA